MLGRPGRSLSGCEQGTKVARVCRNRSEKSSYEIARPISQSCAGFNQATLSVESSVDVTPARVMKWEVRAEPHDLLTRKSGRNAKHSQHTAEGEPLSSAQQRTRPGFRISSCHSLLVKHKNNNWSPGTPAPGKLRQGGGKFKAGLDYRAGQFTKSLPPNEKKLKKAGVGLSGDVFAQHT